jgi:hypothetical protein
VLIGKKKDSRHTKFTMTRRDGKSAMLPLAISTSLRAASLNQRLGEPLV